MKTASTIAVSGMNAAMLSMDVAAHNIANAMTPDFQRQQVVQQTQPGGGVQASVSPAKIPNGSLFLGDLVQDLAASYAFKANLKVIETQDKMIGSLLDVAV